jgi:hypothetical protein
MSLLVSLCALHVVFNIFRFCKKSKKGMRVAASIFVEYCQWNGTTITEELHGEITGPRDEDSVDFIVTESQLVMNLHRSGEVQQLDVAYHMLDATEISDFHRIPYAMNHYYASRLVTQGGRVPSQRIRTRPTWRFIYPKEAREAIFIFLSTSTLPKDLLHHIVVHIWETRMHKGWKMEK